MFCYMQCVKMNFLMQQLLHPIPLQAMLVTRFVRHGATHVLVATFKAMLHRSTLCNANAVIPDIWLFWYYCSLHCESFNVVPHNIAFSECHTVIKVQWITKCISWYIHVIHTIFGIIYSYFRNLFALCGRVAVLMPKNFISILSVGEASRKCFRTWHLL